MKTKFSALLDYLSITIHLTSFSLCCQLLSQKAFHGLNSQRRTTVWPWPAIPPTPSSAAWTPCLHLSPLCLCPLHRLALWTSAALPPAAARKRRMVDGLQILPVRTSSSNTSTTVSTAVKVTPASRHCPIIRCPTVLHSNRPILCPLKSLHVQPSTANTAPRSTPAWGPWKCTFAHTHCPVCAPPAARPSQDHGCSEDTFAHTQVCIKSNFSRRYVRVIALISQLCWLVTVTAGCTLCSLIFIDVSWRVSKCYC